MTIETRRFNFLSGLTGIVVLLYVIASGIALWQQQATWSEFSGAVGPVAGALMGYWLRGEKGNE